VELFPELHPWPQRERFRGALAILAAENVYLGTSSWKYPGWCGQLYDPSRYNYHGKFSESRFNKRCLEEYAEVFKAVCVDAGYYQFPNEKYLSGLVSQVPSDFKFSFKVTEEITIKKFTRLPRYGARAGKPNSEFLNADLFCSAFLGPCEPFRDQIGLLMFEFSRFYKSDFDRGREFVEALDDFLGQLPSDWQYGIEIRNEDFLHTDYFACLAKHGVAHVFNNWQRMPPISAQLALKGSRTQPKFAGARFLLKSGRPYAEAVERFSPYRETREIDDDARQAGADMIKDLVKTATQPSFLFVNNRLEGNALNTIAAMLERAGLLT
jgi:uncharacterized protein YecE (DUF72 family)